MRRLGANMVVLVALWLTACTVALAASASADDRLAGEVASDQQVTTVGRNADAPVGDPPRARHPPESPTENVAPAGWPWLEIEPGHDKCKRRRALPLPLPLWCFGLSSWPVMKAHAVTATVKGIQDPSRRAAHAAELTAGRPWPTVGPSAHES